MRACKRFAISLMPAKTEAVSAFPACFSFSTLTSTLNG